MLNKKRKKEFENVEDESESENDIFEKKGNKNKKIKIINNIKITQNNDDDNSEQDINKIKNNDEDEIKLERGDKINNNKEKIEDDIQTDDDIDIPDIV